MCRADEIADGEARGFDLGRSRVVVITPSDHIVRRASCDDVGGGMAVPSDVGSCATGATATSCAEPGEMR
jgi:hypothetical protein